MGSGRLRAYPLIYPGGKAQGIKLIRPHLPKGLRTLVSPFFGGGALEIELARSGVKVMGYDGFEPVASYWRHQIISPSTVADAIDAITVGDASDYAKLKLRVAELPCSADLAAAVWAVHQCSMYAGGCSAGFCPSSAEERFDDHRYRDLVRNFRIQNLTVGFRDFRETLRAHTLEFLYLDPPYWFDDPAKECLYGFNGDMHRGFPHFDLFELLKDRRDWILSYNDSEVVRHVYHGFPIQKLSWRYNMNGPTAARELLIFPR